ncbi:MAG TPA: flippase-like domain-containing protein [Gammaproteobacteria bacterium]
MRFLPYLGLICGLLLLGGLLIWQGLMDVITLLLDTGWILLVLPLVWLPNALFAAESWRLLFSNEHRPTFRHAGFAMWLGRSVNNLLPVASLGGEVVKARMLILWDNTPDEAMASVLVDKTVQTITVIIWGLIGIALLLYLALDDYLALMALGGFGILTLCASGLLLLQKHGAFHLATRLAEKLIKSDNWEGIHVSARGIDEKVRIIYKHKRRFAFAVFLKVCGAVIQTGEVWLACYLLGFPISLIEALMLKSLTSTLADMAFLIPNGYGVQEGTYLLLATLLGMSPELALAVSLATRIRELIFDLPGLLTWHFIEGKLLLERRRPAID